MNLESRFLQLKSQLNEVQLVAVSKGVPWENIQFLYELGQRDFGENRIGELEEKAQRAKSLGLKDLRWHFLGHIQSNKVKSLLELTHLNLTTIHSMDRLKILKLFIEHSKLISPLHPLEFYLEVNTSGETEKLGAGLDELNLIINFLSNHQDQLLNSSLSSLKFMGLMTMGKLRGDDFLQDASVCFKKIRDLRDEIQKKFTKQKLKLSCGMSQDFEVALACGTDVVRIGSYLFSNDQ